MTVTLADILRSRDERQCTQRELLNRYGKPLISLTVVMPGEVKLNEASLYIGSSAVEEILKRFGRSMLFSQVNTEKPAGFEAFFVIEYDESVLKRAACGIEDSHPLGRLFDMDVIGLDGIPITREKCGLPERRCLICNDAARNCIRAQRHSVNEIITKIESITHKAQNV